MKGLQLTLEFVDVDPALTNSLYINRHFSTAVYLRIMLAELLPTTVRKVVYLDSDLLVTGDISELWQVDITDHSLLAVQDMLVVTVSHDEFGLYNWKDLGFPADHAYFNAGVLVVNLERWRERRTADSLFAYIDAERECLRFLEQDALNAVLGRDWKPLDLKWNTFPLILGSKLGDMEDGASAQLVHDSYSDITQRPAVYHFITHLKPWIPGRRVPHRRLWMNVLRRSGYFSAVELARWGVDWTVKHYIRGMMSRLPD